MEKNFVMRSFIFCTPHHILSGGVIWAGREEERGRSWDLVGKPEEKILF
jgi:hypothetical protein